MTQPRSLRSRRCQVLGAGTWPASLPRAVQVYRSAGSTALTRPASLCSRQFHVCRGVLGGGVGSVSCPGTVGGAPGRPGRPPGPSGPPSPSALRLPGAREPPTPPPRKGPGAPPQRRTRGPPRQETHQPSASHPSSPRPRPQANAPKDPQAHAFSLMIPRAHREEAGRAGLDLPHPPSGPRCAAPCSRGDTPAPPSTDRARRRADGGRKCGGALPAKNRDVGGLRSIARNNKATRLFTRPRRTTKSYARDLTPRMVKLQSAGWPPGVSPGEPSPAC